MASISAAISLFVLLLATYCYSIPIGTEFEHSTVDSKLIGERNVLPFTSFEETTIEPQIHSERSGNIHHESDESREYTTVHSWSTEDKKEKRTIFDETTVPLNERSVDGVEFEETTVVPKLHIKRTKTIGHDDDSESREYTTERSWSTEEKKEKRTIFDETTSSLNERDVDLESDVTKDEDKRENEQVIFDITTSGVHFEESKATRNFDLDLVHTVESSTEFNGRASRFMESESDVDAITEPTSSFESLAHSTGLLNTRTFPETVEHKFEGAREEVYTTFKPDY